MAAMGMTWKALVLMSTLLGFAWADKQEVASGEFGEDGLLATVWKL